MPTSATLATLLALSYVSVRFVSAQRQCFWPNGTLSPDSPCKPAASASACCGLGWNCLSNGLCRQSGSAVRGSCTDQTWSTNECPPYCAFNDTTYAVLVPCNAGSTVGDGGAELSSYCCDHDSYCDCTTGKNVILLNPNPATVTSLDSASSTSTASSTTSIPSISILTPSASTSNLVAATLLSSATAEASSHHTVAIGVGLGVLAGLAILGVVPFLLLRIRDLKRRTTTQPNLDIRAEQPSISHMRQPSIAEMQQPSIAEMQERSRSWRYELDHNFGVGQALPALCELEASPRTNSGREGV